jgi:hypothetical protein
MAWFILFCMMFWFIRVGGRFPSPCLDIFLRSEKRIACTTSTLLPNPARVMAFSFSILGIFQKVSEIRPLIEINRD